MSNLSDDILVEIKKLFDRYDTDDNEIIDWDEFRNMVDELDIDISLENKAKIFNIIDANHTGMINFEEFAKIWEKERK